MGRNKFPTFKEFWLNFARERLTTSDTFIFCSGPLPSCPPSSIIQKSEQYRRERQKNSYSADKCHHQLKKILLIISDIADWQYRVLRKGIRTSRSRLLLQVVSFYVDEEYMAAYHIRTFCRGRPKLITHRIQIRTQLLKAAQHIASSIVLKAADRVTSKVISFVHSLLQLVVLGCTPCGSFILEGIRTPDNRLFFYSWSQSCMRSYFRLFMCLSTR